MKKYSIVIPTYNHCNDLLSPCIESIFKYTNITDIELIIVAIGCTDNTRQYLDTLSNAYSTLGLLEYIKIVWHDTPLGYSRACNEGIRQCTTDHIVLLNNDTILLPQEQNRWLDQLHQIFKDNNKAGISCVLKTHSDPAGHDFAIFFCVMIHRKVFDKIGLLNEEYGVGGGEDTEFSIECERAGFEVVPCVSLTWDNGVGLHVGDYPIYHRGEGTVHDASLVPNWNDVFLDNSLKLAKKYNPKWYQWRLSNYWERAVYLKGDTVDPREVTRYMFAGQNILGTRVFELGCSSGYGIQFLPVDIIYTGLDYDKRIVEVARDQKWNDTATFINADINKHDLEQYDTIIAYEVIEHLDNGLEIVDTLKLHCKRLIISVPLREPVGLWGPHHKLHNLDQKHFPGFEFKHITFDGVLKDGVPDTPTDGSYNQENINLLLCIWTKS